MIVVSNTSPILYLLLIGQLDLLPQLYSQAIIPDVVQDEMLALGAPERLQQWIANPPSWLTVQTTNTVDETLTALDPGEQAAITLAQEIQADLLLIDERRGRRAARDRGLRLIGVLGVLDDAADRGLIDLADAIFQLQQTNFRVSARLLQALLRSNPSKGSSPI